MRPSITRRDLEARIDRSDRGARRHVAPTSASPAAGRRSRRPPSRSKRAASSSHERGRFRVRERSVLRYYARTIEHLLADAGRARTSDSSCRCSTARRRPFSTSSPAADARRRSRPATACAQPDSFARRFIAGETVDEAIEAARAVEARGLLQTLDYLGESVGTLAEADAATRDYLHDHRRRRRRRASAATCR